MRLKILIVIFYIFQYCFSQYYLTGEDPASIRWNQIRTNNFNIIFPAGFEEKATTTANYIEYVYKKFSDPNLNIKSKIPVILHNQTVYSNGIVVWAPKRMELFTLPSQSMYSQNWIEQLMLHEVRHVSQIELLRNGLSKHAGIIFGEQALGAVTGLVPYWYYEGDAVYAETVFSEAGRGRMPSFQNSIIAANLEQKKRYSYDQIVYGSYKYNIPSIYAYGYQMVDYGHKQFGDELWNNILLNVGKKPFTFTPFYFGLKKQTGFSKEQFYNKTYDYLDSIWKGKLDLIKLSDDEIYISPETEYYTNYMYPKFVNDSTIITLKEGIDQTREFVLINLTGNERVICKPGPIRDSWFSYYDDKIVWAEHVFDTRWEHRTYSCIKLYNLRTNESKNLLKKGRYFSPALSPDGTKVSVIEANIKSEFSLKCYDIKEDIFSTLLTYTGNEVIQTPSWINDEEIVYILLNDSGKSIEKFNIRTRVKSSLYHAGTQNISNPVVLNNYITFNYDHGEIHDIYFLDTLKSVIYNYLKSKFGVFNINKNTNSNLIVCNQYHSQGFRICIENFNPTNLQIISDFSKEEIIENNPEIIDFKKINKNEYEIDNYSKLGHLFNIHSWAPFYFDYQEVMDNPFYIDVSPGLLLFTQNSLGTAYGNAGYGYDKGRSFIKSSFTYKGIYPVFNIDIQKGGEPHVLPSDTIPPQGMDNDNTSIYLQTYIPININKNRWNRSVLPAIAYSFSNSYVYNFYDQMWGRNLSYLIYQVNISQYQIKAYRDLLPKYGHITTIKFFSPVFENKKLFPTIVNIKNTLYFPGLLKHHHIQLNIDYEAQQISAFRLNSYLNFPRGFNKEISNTLIVTRLNYRFPLLYPDYNLSWLLYLKRIKLNIFYDYGYNKFYKHEVKKFTSKEYYSYGLELTNDLHFVRIIFPLNVGFRLSLSHQFDKPVSELIFYMNLDNF